MPTASPDSVVAGLGTSVGDGIIVYQIARASDNGLARIEIGRSRFRHAASPSLLYNALPSLNYVAVVEIPLYIDMRAIMGLSRYGSDDDDDASDPRRMYCFNWVPEARPPNIIYAHLSSPAPCGAFFSDFLLSISPDFYRLLSIFLKINFLFD